jgi:hypothetical protein
MIRSILVCLSLSTAAVGFVWVVTPELDSGPPATAPASPGTAKEVGAARPPAPPEAGRQPLPPSAEGDDKRRARLNFIAHILSMVPYEDATPPSLKLPPRRPSDESYVRPPKSDQHIVPDLEL